MALTQGARNKIKSFVQSAKRLLMNEFAAQVQQHYGIRPDGSCLMVEELTTNDGSIIQTARLLRERLDYLEDTIAGSNKKEEAVKQLLREQAFTILNRFAAIRMAEERNIIPETIKKGYNSEGFQVFDQLSGGAQTAEQFERYNWFLKAMFDELAIDLPAVFDRFSPYSLLFPSEKVMLELLDIIDDEDLSIYREEGQQPINLWEEDETIGWVYQYYNSREEISVMREASGAPRNSRELAVRNQFFTPRYVVQFLVDNSLGRQWFEMTKGETTLVDDCQYMVKREQEIFLNKGEAIPETKIEGANYIEHRTLKDPREILMLDPACGSMHFGLYCFDLFEQIYLEAWDNHSELMPDLRDKYLREDYIKRIPGYILQYNIHGVDIDPRAIQIAGLSLWLRAQRSYKKLGLQPADRPMIKKSNLVVAEPMPGDAELLSEFTRSLPGPIGKLVRVIWDKMQLAGETGLLLKIEEELKKEIEIAKQEYKQYKGGATQTSIFGGVEDAKAAEMAAIYGKDQKITQDFFDTAEDEVLKALQSFSENAEGEHAFQKLLFAEDTARGFAFIELCRKRYDVIVMNPPFGDSSIGSKIYIDDEYKRSYKDLAAVFIERTIQLLKRNGQIGCISTRSIFYLGSYSKWREELVIQGRKLETFLDLGMGVLDAMVETAAYILSNKGTHNESTFLRLTNSNYKNEDLTKTLSGSTNNIYNVNILLFLAFNNSPFCYWVDSSTTKLFANEEKFDNGKRGARQGMKTGDNDRYVRNHWELRYPVKDILSGRWNLYLLSDYSLRFCLSQETVVYYANDGYELKHHFNEKGQLRSRPMDTYDIFNKSGLSWSFRTNKFKPHLVREGHIAQPGRCIAVFEDQREILTYLAFWNSDYVDYWMKLGVERAGHPKFINGLVNNLPHPSFDNDLSNQLVELSKLQFIRTLELFKLDDRSVDLQDNKFTSFKTINNFIKFKKSYFESIAELYVNDLDKLNKLVYNYYLVENIDDIESIINQSGGKKENSQFEISSLEITFRIFSIIVGGIFGRIDLRFLKCWKQEWSDEDMFKERKHSPFLYGPRASTLDLVLPEYHDKIKEIWEMPYPIKTLEECATVSEINSITDKLKEVIKYFWPDSNDTIVEELLEHFKVNDLDEIFDKHSKFFDAHLKDYSRNKRISPIYWHLGVPSGKFNIWVYYPKLNENSLFKIVNELVEPKLEDVKKQVAALEMSSASKELHEQMALRDELIDFKEELLRVAQLPYKPNQDDGVLITAAPLHNLFRHTKWRKSTEDCWKKLKKGDYDWAHLAYSIWPDRVTKKCKKDLSMAIAHGLESICEIKPKETKERTKPEIKVEIQNKLL
ncbi:BREX-1 system adenine-specific DNA-methyltransferase PglX [Gaetbulibacter saemankumensis]|uniref:BREX-1 system adenine-specific DNA-methyltransferase PglX n=1 Tax=Gaetbulibacter saemankumensis TaxID=311208 RepID=UPI0004161324|nr:BREX-1 system adenine-specific DNA-methyltransferase PglX [Gaetbulibacter saemankumensis]